MSLPTDARSDPNTTADADARRRRCDGSRRRHPTPARPTAAPWRPAPRRAPRSPEHRAPRSAGSTPIADVAWTNLVFLTDQAQTSYANTTAPLDATGTRSRPLIVTGYGFTIPDNAVIDGVVVDIWRGSPNSATAGIRDEIVRLQSGNTNSLTRAKTDKWPSHRLHVGADVRRHTRQVGRLVDTGDDQRVQLRPLLDRAALCDRLRHPARRMGRDHGPLHDHLPVSWDRKVVTCVRT